MNTTSNTTTSPRTVAELRSSLLALKVGIHQFQQNSSNDRGVILGLSPKSYQKGVAGQFDNQRDEAYFRARALEICDAAHKNGVAVQVQTYYTGKDGEQRASFGLTLSHGNSQAQAAAPRLSVDETLTDLMTSAVAQNIDVDAILTGVSEGDMGKMVVIARLRKALGTGTTSAPTQTTSDPPVRDEVNEIPF